jgi:hypothetical protein
VGWIVFTKSACKSLFVSELEGAKCFPTDRPMVVIHRVSILFFVGGVLLKLITNTSSIVSFGCVGGLCFLIVSIFDYALFQEKYVCNYKSEKKGCIHFSYYSKIIIKERLTIRIYVEIPT